MLYDGLYEQIISKALDRELAISVKRSQTAPINKAETAKALAKYVAEIVERGLENMKDNGGDLNSQVELVNRLVSAIVNETRKEAFEDMSVAERAEQLLALLDTKNAIHAVDSHAEIVRPETSIPQSSLFTGAVHEP